MEYVGCQVVPYDGMSISTSTVLTEGSYALPNGIFITGDDLVLDMVSIHLDDKGISISGRTNVTILSGYLQNYFYGVIVTDSSDVTILEVDSSTNWVDPNSFSPICQIPPIYRLDINCSPNLADHTNLGGGFFFNNVTNAYLSKCRACQQENGYGTWWGGKEHSSHERFDMYSVTQSTIDSCNATDNTGWGIHLSGSRTNTISNSFFDRNTRSNLGDSAGILLVQGSSDNKILRNSATDCGDGFFIGNEWGIPSDNNVVQGNDCSSAGANAFEATFSTGNHFIENKATSSNYGFWLGYSHDGTIVEGNEISFNKRNGIEIDHGQRNSIQGNFFQGNLKDALFTISIYLMTTLNQQVFSLHIRINLKAGYTVSDNTISGIALGWGIHLIATTASSVFNNAIYSNDKYSRTASADSSCTSVKWAIDPPITGPNIIQGPEIAGNFWNNYLGTDTNGDGLGDTYLPYNNEGNIQTGGDQHPLVL
ncbi:hypothetical protein Pelo_3820 [Pelomyxa schiedti]|nr:hypothetical protein Pelo_3820 [Pelomyxa schiedti]